MPSALPSTCSGSWGSWPPTMAGSARAATERTSWTERASTDGRAKSQRYCVGFIYSPSGDAGAHASPPERDGVVDDRCNRDDADRHDKNVGELGQHHYHHQGYELDDRDDFSEQSGSEDSWTQRWNNFGDYKTHRCRDVAGEKHEILAGCHHSLNDVSRNRYENEDAIGKRIEQGAGATLIFCVARQPSIHEVSEPSDRN